MTRKHSTIIKSDGVTEESLSNFLHSSTKGLYFSLFFFPVGFATFGKISVMILYQILVHHFIIMCSTVKFTLTYLH